MRFLADENFPAAAIGGLREAGHDVVCVRFPAACGIVLFRIPLPRPDAVGRRLTDLIGTRDDWAGYFSVVEPGRLRMPAVVAGHTIPLPEHRAVA